MKNRKKVWKDILVVVLVIVISIWPAGFIADVKGWPDYYAKSSEQAEELFLRKLEQLDSVLERYDLQTTPHTKSIEELYSNFFSEVYLDNGESVLIQMKWRRNREIYCWITLVGASSPTAETCIHDLDAYPYVYEMASCLSHNCISPKKFYRLAQSMQENAIEELQQYPTHAEEWCEYKYITVDRGLVEYTIEQTGDAYRAIADFLLEV